MADTERPWVNTWFPQGRDGVYAADVHFSHNLNRWALGVLPEVMFVDRACWSVDLYLSIGPLHLSLGVMPGRDWPWKPPKQK